jgi:hypothetical protein
LEGDRPGQAGPVRAGPGQAGPGQARPGQAVMGQAWPDQTGPGQTTPDRAGLDRAGPGRAGQRAGPCDGPTVLDFKLNESDGLAGPWAARAAAAGRCQSRCSECRVLGRGVFKLKLLFRTLSVISLPRTRSHGSANCKPAVLSIEFRYFAGCHFGFGGLVKSRVAGAAAGPGESSLRSPSRLQLSRWPPSPLMIMIIIISGGETGGHRASALPRRSRHMQG